MDRENLSAQLLPDSHETMPLGRAKRRKIAVACETCRVRKVRCDGTRPACGPCVARYQYHGGELSCIYSRHSAKNASSKVYTQSESAIPQEVYLQPTQTHHAQAQQFPSIASGLETVTSSSDRPTCGVSPTLPCSSGDTQERTNNAEGVNAMVGEVDAGERYSTQGFFGSSSAGGFMRQIRIAIESKVPSVGITNPQSYLFERDKENKAPNPAIMSNHVLPPRRIADHFMEIYWEFVFPLYPFFDREQLSAEYLKIWNGECPPNDEDMLICTFNVIFALCCQLSETIEPENRAATADSFFSCTKQLIQFNLWQPGSTTLIQCLLLMSQYLQSTDHADQCWMVTGMAIRTAQSLGLHLPETSLRLGSSQKRELARRLWHGCVLMDRVVALTLGRPPMISKEAASAVSLPTMVDDEIPQSLAESRTTGWTERPSFMAFYAKCLELYEILNDILLSLYKNSNPPDKPEDHHNYYFRSFHEGQVTVFQLDYALTEWSRSLPSIFHNQSTPVSENHFINRQRVVLRLRFLHIRIVLLRPILSNYCSQYSRSSFISSEYSLPQRFALQCSIVCVKSAQDLIDLTYANLPPDNTIGLLPAWWYNILYVYTAAMVLIAGRFQQEILSELTEESIYHAWLRALEILRRYQGYSASAQRCLVALELLYEKLRTSVSVGQNCCPTAPGSPLPEVTLAEELPVAILDTLGLPDFVDMSWLSSVPSNLF